MCLSSGLTKEWNLS